MKLFVYGGLIIASINALKDYIYVPEVVNYTTAKAGCEALGTTLASLTNQADDDYANELCPNVCWVGLEQAPNEGQWCWIDGSGCLDDECFYVNWNPDEPNNLLRNGVGENFGQIRGPIGWNDEQDYFKYPYICNPIPGNGQIPNPNEECPCYSVDDFDPDLTYCKSGCCGTGVLVRTKKDGDLIEYGIQESDVACENKCFIKKNGVIILQQSISDSQIVACDVVIADATPDVNCTISDTINLNILDSAKQFVRHAFKNDDGKGINTALIGVYGAFILMLIATVLCGVIICMKKVYNCVFKPKKDAYYHIANDTSTQSDISSNFSDI